ncbi:MAG: hypothetical protein ABIR46_04235 [Candidatus Saccharimonadales bacterium]
MSVYKFLIAATLVFVSALLIGGIYYPGSFAMILADTKMTFTVLRAVVCILLIGLLLTNPPRSIVLRSIVGAGSVFLLIMISYLLLNFQMYLLDAIVFLEVTIIFGIEALESRKTVMPIREKHTGVHKIPVYTN